MIDCFIRYSVKNNLVITSTDLLSEELQLYKSVGGNSVVDCTSIGIRYKPELLPELSATSGVHIICGSAYYVDQFMPSDVKLMSMEEIASVIIQEVTQGIKGTEVRCGVIGEVGCSAPLTDTEIRSLQAAAVAQRATGNSVSYSIHYQMHHHIALNYYAEELKIVTFNYNTLC